MTTNILLIIIIVLLALILFVELSNLLAISSIPEQLIESFFDFNESIFDSDETPIVDVSDLDPKKRKQRVNTKGSNYKNYKWSIKKIKNSTKEE